MIIQCDQCKTKFRLDDSKVTASGVRVRCSRCKHTFVVRKEVCEDAVDLHEPVRESGTSTAFDGKQQDGFAEEAASHASSGRNDGELGGHVNTFADFSENLPGGGVPVKSDDHESDMLSGALFGSNLFSRDGGSDGEKPVIQWPSDDQTELDRELPYNDSDLEGGKSADEPEAHFSGVNILSGDNDTEPVPGNGLESEDAGVFAAKPVCNFNNTESDSDQSWEVFSNKEHFSENAGSDAPADFLPDSDSVSTETDGFSLFGAGEAAVPDHLSAATTCTASEAAADLEQEDDQWKEGGPVELLSISNPVKDGTSERNNGEFAHMAEDDLPPLAITSRRKSAWSLSAMLAAVFLLVFAAGGASLYFSGTDLTSLKVPGLPLLTSKFPSGAEEAGALAIKNLNGSFVRDNQNGELFVVMGEAFNQSGKPYSSFSIKGYVFNAKGAVVKESRASVGKSFSSEDLAGFAGDENAATSVNQPESSPQDQVIQPGAALPFFIVFRNVPHEAAEFGAEVVGATASIR